MLGETVTEIVLSAYLVNHDLAASDLILEPQFTELHMSHSAKATQVGNALGCAGICGEGNTRGNIDVIQHAL